MNRRQIGNTGIQVNEIGYGGMSLSIQGRPEEEHSIALLQRIVEDLGVELIDTADAYCLSDDEVNHNERLIARALRGPLRERVTIATKGGFVRPEGRWEPNGRPEHLRAACERSLRALETDRIDLYQFHRPDPAVPIEESLGAIAEMQREGKIRHIGVSNFSLDQLRAAREVVEVVSIQNPFSLAFYQEAVHDELLRYCEENGITWIAYAPVGGHRNAHQLNTLSEAVNAVGERHGVGPHEIVLDWILRKSPAILPIPASTKFEHVASNMAAADLRLSPDDIAEIETERASQLGV